jgi:UDP-N-acetylmuramyl pentapeptide phosphotransferase/UDP-N-acetylglucosamine-1-phosphate transferase
MSDLAGESVWSWVVVPLAVLGASVWLTGIMRDWLRRRAILDHPGERTSHEGATPRGGGLALVPVVLFAWLMLALAGDAPSGTYAIVGLAAALGLVSWFDDLGGLAFGWRLAAHLIAATLGVTYLLGTGLVFQGLLPPLVDHIAAALLWAWFINLYNFMDGIDGITCVETIAIGIGVVLVAQYASDEANAAVPALALSVGALGFLRWNWPRASIFLGDVGSVPLGYLLGFLLLDQAARGRWKLALILPLYFLADATITLLRRLARRERIWEPHRRHFYQGAVQRGFGHAAIVERVIAANIVLIGCGWAAENGWPIVGLAVAGTTVLLLLGWLAIARPAR